MVSGKFGYDDGNREAEHGDDDGEDRLRSTVLGDAAHELRSDAITDGKQEEQDHGLEGVLDWKLLDAAQPALNGKQKVYASFAITNTDRTVGTILSNEISKKFKAAGLPEDTLHFKFTGTAGQSFGAFAAGALAYNELNFGRLADLAPAADEVPQVEIKAAWFETDDGERVTEIDQGTPCTMCFEAHFHAAVEEPVFAFHLRNEPRHIVFATQSDWRLDHVGRFAAGESARVRVRFENWLAPNRYTLTPGVALPGGEYLQLREDLAALAVLATRHTGGIADVPHDFVVERT